MLCRSHPLFALGLNRLLCLRSFHQYSFAFIMTTTTLSNKDIVILFYENVAPFTAQWKCWCSVIHTQLRYSYSNMKQQISSAYAKELNAVRKQNLPVPLAVFSKLLYSSKTVSRLSKVTLCTACILTPKCITQSDGKQFVTQAFPHPQLFYTSRKKRKRVEYSMSNILFEKFNNFFGCQTTSGAHYV